MLINQPLLVIVFISVSLNVTCFVLSVWFITKRGVFPYLATKIPLLKVFGIDGAYKQRTPLQFPYYHHRQSQLALLPIRTSAIVFLGDSITDEGEWSELFDHPEIKNRGVSSDTTIGVLSRLDPIVSAQPQKIFLMIGVNDLLNQRRSPVAITRTYKDILVKIQQTTPHTRLFIQSVLPVNQTLLGGHAKNREIRELNRQIQQLAAEFSCEYLDLFPHFIDAQEELSTDYTLDGIHLNGAAYQHWKALIEDHVMSPIEARKA